MKNLYKIEDELYIVSNTENISENCWIITNDKLVQVSYLLSDEVAKGFKVILTTNDLLIKDGVQAIDDEFLEWFIKNPNCEEVDVEQVSIMENRFVLGYKIIIPKEESLSYEDFRKKASKELLEKFDNEASKGSGDGDFDNYFYGNCRYWENKLKEEPTRKTDTCYNFNKEIGCVQTDCRCEKEELKQETLEEAANGANGYNVYAKETKAPIFNEGFIAGAKWQAERMYSEEEVIKLLIHCKDRFGGSELEDYTHDDKIKKWFEQFKKTIKYEQ